MVANPVVPERDFRGPGCSDECKVLRVFQAGVFGRQELLVHDPESHEQYGRILAGDPGALDVLETGTLAFNRRTLNVFVEGREVRLTPTELRMVSALADQVGSVVPYHKLIAATWPDHAAAGLSGSHLTTVHLSRLRGKLGSAAGLIVTRASFGLRLRVAPTGTPAPYSPNLPRALLDGRWSMLHACCRNCGTTNHQHGGHGYCRLRACRQAYELTLEAAP